MKNFLKQFLKLGSLVLVVVLIMVGAVSYSFKNKKAENAFAGTGENMSGFAWSENTGLISFNSTNCDTDNDGKSNGGTGCPASGTTMSSYGVNIQETDIGSGNTIGKLSGYAWSENIGWITFNRDNAMPSGSTPPKNDVGATYNVLSYIDTDGKTLNGWARATAACDENSDGDCSDSGESDAGANAGGWDGWIALSDMSTSTPDYGITLDTATKQFKGWGWDGLDTGVIGWLSFNKLNCDSDNNGKVDVACGSDNSSTPIGDYKVSTTFELNLPPDKPESSSLSVSDDVAGSDDSSYCPDEGGYLTFNWDFTDPNDPDSSAGKQKSYEIKACYRTTCTPSTIIKSADSSAEFAKVYLADITDKLGSSWYGKALRWSVKVWDNGGVVSKSNESDPVNFFMASSEYPDVSFEWNPAQIYAEQDIQFLDKSTCAPSACDNWSWDIPDAAYQSGTTSTSQNPVVRFSQSAQNITMTLTAKNTTNNYSCKVSASDIGKTVNIGTAIPEFEEKK